MGLQQDCVGQCIDQVEDWEQYGGGYVVVVVYLVIGQVVQFSGFEQWVGWVIGDYLGGDLVVWQVEGYLYIGQCKQYECQYCCDVVVVGRVFGYWVVGFEYQYCGIVCDYYCYVYQIGQQCEWVEQVDQGVGVEDVYVVIEVEWYVNQYIVYCYVGD